MIYKVTTKRKLSEGEVFYLVNHLDVLGIEKGCEQISYRMNMDPAHIKTKYFEEKKKTSHIAV